MLYALLLAGSLLAPDTTRSLEAIRIPEGTAAPALDGRLDEAVWSAAPVASDFLQMAPRYGAAASQRTEARVLYDGRSLYVGMRMYDAHPDSIAAQLARRDAFGIYSDWAHVVIDSYHDHRTAFRFSVNPRGVKKDVFHYGDTGEDLSWDAVWDVATRVDSLGWTAEFRIPLSQLRFEAQAGEQSWGINFGREIARGDERAYWSPVQPNTGRFVSYEGSLRGLRNLRRPERLELQPYVLSRYTRAPAQAGNPYYRPNDMGASFGADVKYGVTSDLTLTATLNPDFGQVEADPSEVNLSAFESYFSERRPFFVEGMDIFTLGVGQVDVNGNEQLFYSRRIGRAPQRGLAVDGFVDAPQGTTILGAAKLSGKTKRGWSVGLLDAVTAAEGARVFEAGRERTLPIEPATNYAVARVSRDFQEGRGSLGAVVTAVNRRIEPGSGLDFLRDEAYVGGLDGRHRFRGGDYEISGLVLASHVGGSPRAIRLAQSSTARLFQRPDARYVELDTTRTALEGLGASMEVGKIAGGHWRWGVSAATRTPGFEVNDLGYQRLADASTVIGSARFVQDRPGRQFRRWSAGLDAGSSWTYGGERFLSAVVPRVNGQLRNLWSGGIQFVRFLPALSPTTLRGGPALYTPGANALFTDVESDPRRRLRLEAFGSYRAVDGGGYSLQVGPGLAYRPSGRADVGFQPLLARNVEAWQYLTRRTTGGAVGGATEYLGGRLDQTTLVLTTRASYSFAPDLSLQLYAQPFVSAGRYSDLRAVADPRAPAFDDRFRPATADLRPDFGVGEFRGNAVLRWEYRPGSTLFVVWSQGREQLQGGGAFGGLRDVGRLFGLDPAFPAPATHVLLIKASYWIGR